MLNSLSSNRCSEMNSVDTSFNSESILTLNWKNHKKIACLVAGKKQNRWRFLKEIGRKNQREKLCKTHPVDQETRISGLYGVFGLAQFACLSTDDVLFHDECCFRKDVQRSCVVLSLELSSMC